MHDFPRLRVGDRLPVTVILTINSHFTIHPSSAVLVQVVAAFSLDEGFSFASAPSLEAQGEMRGVIFRNALYESLVAA